MSNSKSKLNSLKYFLLATSSLSMLAGGEAYGAGARVINNNTQISNLVGFLNGNNTAFAGPHTLDIDVNGTVIGNIDSRNNNTTVNVNQSASIGTITNGGTNVIVGSPLVITGNDLTGVSTINFLNNTSVRFRGVTTQVGQVFGRYDIGGGQSGIVYVENNTTFSGGIGYDPDLIRNAIVRNFGDQIHYNLTNSQPTPADFVTTLIQDILNNNVYQDYVINNRAQLEQAVREGLVAAEAIAQERLTFYQGQQGQANVVRRTSAQAYLTQVQTARAVAAFNNLFNGLVLQAGTGLRPTGLAQIHIADTYSASIKDNTFINEIIFDGVNSLLVIDPTDRSVSLGSGAINPQSDGADRNGILEIIGNAVNSVTINNQVGEYTRDKNGNLADSYRLKQIIVNTADANGAVHGTSRTNFLREVYAKQIDIVAGTVRFADDVFTSKHTNNRHGIIRFTGDGNIILADGKRILSTITLAGGQDNIGSLTFEGASQHDYQIGADGARLRNVTAGTGNVTFAKAVYAKEIDIAAGGTVTFAKTVKTTNAANGDAGRIRFTGDGNIRLANNAQILGDITLAQGQNNIGSLTFEGASNHQYKIGAKNARLRMVKAGVGAVDFAEEIHTQAFHVKGGALVTLNHRTLDTDGVILRDNNSRIRFANGLAAAVAITTRNPGYGNVTYNGGGEVGGIGAQNAPIGDLDFTGNGNRNLTADIYATNIIFDGGTFALNGNIHATNSINFNNGTFNPANQNITINGTNFQGAPNGWHLDATNNRYITAAAQQQQQQITAFLNPQQALYQQAQQTLQNAQQTLQNAPQDQQALGNARNAKRSAKQIRDAIIASAPAIQQDQRVVQLSQQVQQVITAAQQAKANAHQLQQQAAAALLAQQQVTAFLHPQQALYQQAQQTLQNAQQTLQNAPQDQQALQDARNAKRSAKQIRDAINAAAPAIQQDQQVVQLAQQVQQVITAAQQAKATAQQLAQQQQQQQQQVQNNNNNQQVPQNNNNQQAQNNNNQQQPAAQQPVGGGAGQQAAQPRVAAAPAAPAIPAVSAVQQAKGQQGNQVSLLAGLKQVKLNNVSANQQTQGVAAQQQVVVSEEAKQALKDMLTGNTADVLKTIPVEQQADVMAFAQEITSPETLGSGKEAEIAKLLEAMNVKFTAEEASCAASDAISGEKTYSQKRMLFAAAIQQVAPEKRAEVEKAVATNATQQTKVTSEVAAVVNNAVNIRIDNIGFQSAPIHVASAGVGVAAGDDDKPAIKKGAWVSGLYGASKQGATKATKGYAGNTGGATIGFDLELNDSSLIGIAYSNVNSHFKYKGGKGDKVDATSQMVSIYGQQQLGERFLLQGIVSGGKSKVKTKVSKLLTNKLASGKLNNSSVSLDTSLSYKIATGSGLVLLPSVGIKYAGYKDSAYNETGTGVHNVTMKAKKNSTLTGIFGIKAMMAKAISADTQIMPGINASLENYFRNKQQKVKAKLAWMENYFENTADSGNKGPKVGYNVGANVLIKHKNIELSPSYNLHMHKKYQSHQGSLKLKISF